MKPIVKTILQVLLFSIAMGFLESAVVVYLRALYYPEGFSFPLKPMSNHIIITELLRELATLIMLLYIGILSGKNFIQRFSFFLFSFAIWDIFYYVFLKALLNWPLHWLEWDILFLIPMAWVGPVLAPCLISLTMMLLALYLIFADYRIGNLRLSRIDWSILCLISLLYILSFTEEQLKLLHEKISFTMVYPPEHYNWYLFGLAIGIFLLWFTHLVYRTNLRLTAPKHE